jgi:hypothetical protein
MKFSQLLFPAALILVAGNATASSLTYLTCEVKSSGEEPNRVFDFTLDEANSTVTFLVKEANATNVERAVFGPETITWTRNNEYFSSTRTINRVDLTFTEEIDISGNKTINRGTCQVKTMKARKI